MTKRRIDLIKGGDWEERMEIMSNEILWDRKKDCSNLQAEKDTF